MSNRTSTRSNPVRAPAASTQSPRLAVEADFYDRIKSGLHWRIGRELRLAGRVLDLGCGSPGLPSYLSQTYHQRVTAVHTASQNCPERLDCSPGGLIRCVSGFASRLHHLVCDNSKDAVVVMCSLHREKQPIAVLKEAYRALRPGGEALIVECPQRWLADQGWHANYFSPEDVQRLLARTGFCDVDVCLIENEQIIWARGFRPSQSHVERAPLPHSG